jgi:osomolarity two-component system sensor histidine kinase SLN1
MDTHPTSTSNNSNTSNQSSSSSPLAAFDSTYARGSPSSSNPAITIEPGLPVLVVDDDPLTRTLMKRILTRLGCHVSTAENGEVALEMILGPQGKHALTPSSDASGNLGPILEQEQDHVEFTEEGKYAVIFLDNQMPVLSGLKAVEKLRQLGRKDLIVGVTGQCFLC